MRTSFRAAPHAPLLLLHPPVCVPPLRAKQRGGGTPPPGLGARPSSLAPLAHTWGTGHRFRAHMASGLHVAPALKPGGGGAWLHTRPRLRVALRAKRREGGAASGFGPCLSTWRANGEGPAPLPHAPRSRAASAQKPRRGGGGGCGFACNRGHAASHSHAAAHLRVAPACKLGEEGGPPHRFWDWVWPSHATAVCKRGKGGGQRGRASRSRTGSVLATPSQSRAPPRFVRNWGDKKGGAGPLPIHAGSPCLVCTSPWPSVLCKGGAKGWCAPPPRSRMHPVPGCPPSVHVVNGVHGRGSA